MGVKDLLNKIKPKEQSCCSVEIEEKKPEVKTEKASVDKSIK